MKTRTATTKITVLALLLCGYGQAATQTINDAQLIKLLKSASKRIDLYSIYMRNSKIERAIVAANTEIGVKVSMLTKAESLLGPADMFANIIYAGYRPNGVSTVNARLLEDKEKPANALMLIDSKYLISGNFGLEDSKLTLSDDPKLIISTTNWFNAIYRQRTSIDAQKLYQVQFIIANPSFGNKLSQQGDFYEKVTKTFKPKTAEDILREERPKR